MIHSRLMGQQLLGQDYLVDVALVKDIINMNHMQSEKFATIIEGKVLSYVETLAEVENLLRRSLADESRTAEELDQYISTKILRYSSDELKRDMAKSKSILVSTSSYTESLFKLIINLKAETDIYLYLVKNHGDGKFLTPNLKTADDMLKRAKHKNSLRYVKKYSLVSKTRAVFTEEFIEIFDKLYELFLIRRGVISFMTASVDAKNLFYSKYENKGNEYFGELLNIVTSLSRLPLLGTDRPLSLESAISGYKAYIDLSELAESVFASLTSLNATELSLYITNAVVSSRNGLSNSDKEKNLSLATDSSIRSTVLSALGLAIDAKAENNAYGISDTESADFAEFKKIYEDYILKNLVLKAMPSINVASLLANSDDLLKYVYKYFVVRSSDFAYKLNGKRNLYNVPGLESELVSLSTTQSTVYSFTSLQVSYVMCFIIKYLNELKLISEDAVSQTLVGVTAKNLIYLVSEDEAELDYAIKAMKSQFTKLSLKLSNNSVITISDTVEISKAVGYVTSFLSNNEMQQVMED